MVNRGVPQLGCPNLAQATKVKARKKCCKSRPRCKRCPVVLKRLDERGLAERVGKRRYELSPELKKRDLRDARGR